MESIRSKFVEAFGEEQTKRVEAAAAEHRGNQVFIGDTINNIGSDKFKGALVAVITYECVSKATYSKHHGITIDPEEFKTWVKSNADLASHDGDFDFWGKMSGLYEGFI